MPGQLHLLGVPRWIENGDTQILTLNKPTLLLLFLAYRSEWTTRSEAAFLFRPDDDEVTALKHLRQLIHRAKPYAWAQALGAKPEQLLLQIPTDVQAFRTAVAEQHWQAATKLYEGPLFAGYDDAELYAYSAWLELERTNLQSAYEEALLKHAQNLETQGEYLVASQVLEKLLKHDLLAENVIQAYLRTLYLAGQRDKALKAYGGFADALRQELSTDPLEETQHLAQSIREAKPLTGSTAPTSQVGRKPTQLPTQATRFIGRKKELQELSQQLARAECRLLSLIGMGGIGKTRLALEAGQQVHKHFPGGVYFAPLATLNTADDLIPALMQVFGLKVAANQDPQAGLLDYLSDKTLLLILDNFEHLSAASPVVAELLEGTAYLKILVTSRESLKLSGEWLFDLQGLRHPSERSDPDSLENYDAVQLFISGVKRVAPQVNISSDDLQTIAHISQTLEGHPLALELASSWARIMPVARIAQELARGYNLFETDLADLPERHRNLRAILDKTWASLSEKKRLALAKLSVFAGGCTLEAAEQVTGSHFSILLALINESLLKRAAGSRLEMHQLVKQYAEHKLSQMPIHPQVLQQYAHYYAGQLSTQFSSASRNFMQLYPDSENCRLAWLWLSQHHHLDPLEQALNGIDYLYSMSGRYLEGNRLYQQTLEHLESHPASPQRDRLMAGIINGLADRAASAGELELAEQHLEQSRVLLAGLSAVEKQLGYVLTSMARLNWHQGNYAQAEHHLKTASQTIAGIGDIRQETNILHGLGLVLRDQGKFAEAEQAYRQALDLYLSMNEVGNAALALNNIGALQLSMNEPQQAQQTLKQGLAMVRDAQLYRAEAHLTLTYGGALYKAENYAEALRQFRAVLALAEQVQEQSIKGDALRMLGNTYLKLGDLAQAQRYLRASLEASYQLRVWPLVLADLLGFAQLFAQQNQAPKSLELLAQVLHHPATKSDSREEGRRLLESLRGSVAGLRGNLEGLVEGLLAES